MNETYRRCGYFSSTPTAPAKPKPRTNVNIETAAQLFHMMQYPGTVEVTLKGTTGILQCVQREDGSGSSFNVQIGNKWIYVKF